MHRRGRIYWLTWALLVLGAAATGVASIQDAFFRGAVAAFLAPLALPLYERAGPRGAAFLGLGTGILWQLFLAHGYGAIVWSDALRAYAMSRFEIDLSVSAAAFAGSALAGALAHRDQRFARAATVGTVLALAMTALPYGFIRSSETARLGPVEITWLMPLENIGEDGRPVRPKGTEVPALSAADRETLRQAFLVIEVAGEPALVDTEGRRLWAVWRKRLHYPGREDGPVRRVFVAWRDPQDDRRAGQARLGSLSLALPEPPDGSCVIEQARDATKVVAGDAHVLDESALLEPDETGWFSRVSVACFGADPDQPQGRLAPVFLLIRDIAPQDSGDADMPWDCRKALRQIAVTTAHGPTPSPMIWVLRREPLETPREACDRPIPPSDRSYLRNYGESWHAPRKVKYQTVTVPDVPGPIHSARDEAADKAAVLKLPDLRVRHTCDVGQDSADKPLPELPRDASPAAK